jgi:hypothetical protein
LIRAENKLKKKDEEDPKRLLNSKPEEELEKQREELDFNCAMSCLSLIRFISDHMQDLSVPVVHQMMEVTDIPCILVPLLELKPWLRKNKKGELEKFEDMKWVPVPESEQSRLPKIEA